MFNKPENIGVSSYTAKEEKINKINGYADIFLMSYESPNIEILQKTFKNIILDKNTLQFPSLNQIKQVYEQLEKQEKIDNTPKLEKPSVWYKEDTGTVSLANYKKKNRMWYEYN